MSSSKPADLDSVELIVQADIARGRALLMDAYNACATTAETLGATKVADEIRRLAFMIEGKSVGIGAIAWSMPSLKKVANE